MAGNPLDHNGIRALIEGNPPLVQEFVSLDAQLQPNGFDLSLRSVARYTSPGAVGASDDDRVISRTEPVDFGPGDWADLDAGAYLVTLNEVVNLPLDVMALGRPRSTLLRSGVGVHTAVWDAGYRGRSQALLVVSNPLGYRAQRNARIMQLVFFQMEQEVSQGYGGRFQAENL